MWEVSGAIIIKKGKVFAAKRGESKYPYVAHKYEFVGGKQEPGEKIEETLLRECREEIGVTVTIDRPFMTVEHTYPDFAIRLHTFLVSTDEEPIRKEHEAFCWIPVNELNSDEWAPADAPIVEKIKVLFGDLTEKKLSSQEIFDGYVLHVTKDTVLLPGGGTSFREVIHHKGAAGVLVVDGEYTYLCRQFRYSVGRVTTEIPAGKRDSFSEDFLDTAKRELLEELGVTDATFTPLGNMIPAIGYSDEVIALYLAENPTFGEQRLDKDEFLNVLRIPLKKAVEMCLDGTIEDSKTITAILKYARMKNL